MKTKPLIIKCFNKRSYEYPDNYYGVFSNGFSFDVEIVGCDFFVGLYDHVEGEGAEKRYDIFIQFDLDDIHDYIPLLSEEDHFLVEICDLIREDLDASITQQLSEGEPVIDLTEAIHDITAEITERAKAHLKVLFSKAREVTPSNENGLS